MTHERAGESARSALGESALTHTVDVTRLPAKGLTIKIEPDEHARKALANQCDILSISAFSAHLKVKPWHKDGVRVSGHVTASLEQACIVTLEPVQEEIDTQIDALFVPQSSKLAKPNINAETRELIIEAEGDDVPELFELPNLDVGAVAAEFFALELNPYPKSPGAEGTQATLAKHGVASDDEPAENPFAALANIRDKL